MSENPARVFPRLSSHMASGRRLSSARFATPLVLSLCFHGALLAALAMVTWSLVRAPARPEPDLSLDLAPAPARAPEARPSAPEPIHRPSEAPADPAPPLPEPTAPAWVDSGDVPPAPPVDAAPALPVLTRPPDAAGVDFAGVRARDIRSVVFVIDASGPSASCLPLVIDELRRSLARLVPTQSFQVLVSRDQTAFLPGAPRAELCPRGAGLLAGDAPNKAGALEWLRTIRPSGRPDPVPALEAALALRPDVVYLLSRSIARTESAEWPAELEAILKRLEEINPDGPSGRPRTLIRAVQFIDEDPTGLMPEIARRHGGIEGYALRTLDDLAQGEARQAAMVEADRRVDRALTALARLSMSGTLARAMLLGADAEAAQALRGGAAEAERELAGLPEDDWTRVVRARALLAQAASEPGDAREGALADVRAALAGVESSSGGVTWMRDLALAWAEPQRWPPGPGPEAPEAFEAEERVLAIARGGAFDPDNPLGDEASGASDVLAREVACAALVRGARVGDRPWSDIDRPWRRWLSPGAEAVPGLTPDATRAWALRALGEQIPPDAPCSMLSPVAHFALGLFLAQGAGGRGTTPGEATPDGGESPAAQAEGVLRDLLARDDADALRADAMLALGTLLLREARPVKQAQGVEWLITRAESMPGAPGEWARARDAARVLLHDASEPGAHRMALGVLEGVLARGRAAEGIRGRADWAEEHAGVLLELASLHKPAMAMSLLERVPEGSARLAEAADRYGALLWPEVERLRAELAHAQAGEEQAAVREQLVERLSRAIELFKRAGQERSLARARLACAGAVRGDRPDLGAALYRAVIESGTVPDAGLATLRIAMGECLAAAGMRAEAWSAIARDLESPPTTEGFWLAWALALEIQLAENTDGSRTREIGARLSTLRAIDPDLGGDATRGRIEAVEAGVRDR